MENPAAAAQSVFGVESPLLLELGAKPRLPKSNRRLLLSGCGEVTVHETIPEEKALWAKEVPQ
jgi:hypothetical protein